MDNRSFLDAKKKENSFSEIKYFRKKLYNARNMMNETNPLFSVTKKIQITMFTTPNEIEFLRRIQEKIFRILVFNRTL